MQGQEQEVIADRGTAPIVRRHHTPDGEGGQVEDPLENEVQRIDELEEDSIPRGSMVTSLKEDEEEVTDEVKIAQRFIKCPFCLDIPRETRVFGCGHIMCVGCTDTWITGKPTQNPVCPICMSSYCHLPRTCEFIDGLVQKLKALKNERKETKEASLQSKEVVGEVEPQKLQVKDVLCLSCKKMLYEPSVLNCGHVFCMSCVLSTNGAEIKCKACGASHASSPRICLQLKGFIKTYFPTEYRSRREEIKKLYTGTSSLEQIMRDDARPEQRAQGAEIHVGIGCDSCGVYPIQGKRYSCQSCKDFDLCDKCSKSDGPIYGRSGQIHSVNHVLDINDSFRLDKVLAVLDEKANAEGGIDDMWEDEDDEEQREGLVNRGVNAGFFWH